MYETELSEIVGSSTSGMVGDCLKGPFVVPGRLTGDSFRNFLDHDVPILLENVFLERLVVLAKQQRNFEIKCILIGWRSRRF